MTAYEIERNKLIPEAERFANEIIGIAPQKRSNRSERINWSKSWNYHFFKRMDEMVKERGI